MTNPMPGILDSIPEVPAKAPAAPRARLGIPKAWKQRWESWMQDPKARTRLRWAGGAAIVAMGIGLYFIVRPIPQPDYLYAPMDDVLGFTMLTDEFNRLPAEERLKLMGDLVKRLRNMSSQDSLLMAGFAAGIAGKAREQIESNLSRLAVDTWDIYAKDYDKVSEDEREAYLERTFVEFSKLMETVGGEARDVSDERRLEEVRGQAARDRQALAENPERAPGGEMLGSAFHLLTNNMGSRATPQQRARGGQMMRDMTRHFRGQDINTGKPK